jgi:hypothetical protein
VENLVSGDCLYLTFRVKFFDQVLASHVLEKWTKTVYTRDSVLMIAFMPSIIPS